MKAPFVPREWGCKASEMIRRTLVLAAIVAATIAVLRLMAFADKPTPPPPVTPHGVHGEL